MGSWGNIHWHIHYLVVIRSTRELHFFNILSFSSQLQHQWGSVHFLLLHTIGKVKFLLRSLVRHYWHSCFRLFTLVRYFWHLKPYLGHACLYNFQYSRSNTTVSVPPSPQLHPLNSRLLASKACNAKWFTQPHVPKFLVV